MSIEMKKITGTLLLLLLAGRACLTADADEALSADSKVGDTVEFGSYGQTGEESESQPLQWLVLDMVGDEALLLSEKLVEAMPFLQAMPDASEDDLKTNWEDSSVREWLNSVFMETAFSESEKNRLIKKVIPCPDMEETDDRPEYETEDTVFLLSEKEAFRYLSRRKKRKAEGTEAAVDGDPGLFVSELTDASPWWLRSPGNKDSCVQVVGAEGAVAAGGYLVSRADIGIRPAVWVSIP